MDVLKHAWWRLRRRVDTKFIGATMALAACSVGAAVLLAPGGDASEPLAPIHVMPAGAEVR